MHPEMLRTKSFLGTQKVPKTARQIVSEREALHRSQSTIETYILELRRLKAKDANVWVAAQKTLSAKTWFLRRAAILYDVETRLTYLLGRLEKIRLFAPTDVGVMTILKIQQCERLSKQIKELVARYNAAPDGLPLVTRKPTQSKRRLGKGLPNDWREQLAARLKNWQMQFLVTAITGCRPAELHHGVHLKVESGYLIAEIVGAKVTAKSGQPLRKLFWSTQNAHPLVQQLTMKVIEAQGEMSVDLTTGRKNNNPKQAFSDAIKAAAKRAWPNRKLSITAYSLRHAVASDLKASPISSAEISAALGHVAIATKSTYGRASGARGRSIVPERVEASRPVRGQPSEWTQPQPAQFGRERG